MLTAWPQTAWAPGGGSSGWAHAALAAAAGPGCERAARGALDEPVAALTSLAFVVAGVVLALRGRSLGARHPASRRAAGSPTRVPLAYAAVVAAVGVGSVVQHGPDPSWSDPTHDLPLLAAIALLGADAAADLAGGRRTWWWWALPVAALTPLVVLTPRAGDLAQVAAAAVAVALAVLRAARRPVLRARTAGALGLLALGATLGTLSRAGWPLCDPASVWQGHGAWHLLAAAALVVLAPTDRPAPGHGPDSAVTERPSGRRRRSQPHVTGLRAHRARGAADG